MRRDPAAQRAIGLRLLRWSPLWSFGVGCLAFAWPSTPLWDVTEPVVWLTSILVLLFTPKSIAWLLVGAPDLLQPIRIRDANAELRWAHWFGLISTAGIILGMAVAMTDDVLIVIASVFSFVIYGFALLVRYTAGGTFVQSVALVTNERALMKRQYRYGWCLLLGVPIVVVLYGARLTPPHESLASNGVLIGVLLLLSGWLVYESWVVLRMLVDRIQSGMGIACGACGYDLREIAGDVCPECGTVVPDLLA